MDWLSFIVSLIEAGIRMGIPIAFGGLGVIIAEKSGVLNIGCEAEMLMGSFITFYIAQATGNYFTAIIAGGLGGALSALIIAYLSISRKQNQSVVGIITNIFITGLTSYLYRVIYGSTTALTSIETLKSLKIPGLSSIPVIGEVLFDQTIIFYVLVVVAIAVYYVLYKLKIGLKLRAVGENPRAAQAGGINVVRYRYIAMICAGFLAGIGGAYLTLGILGKFTENMSAGRGFIGMAVASLSHWHPVLALFCSLVFGVANALQLRLQAFGIEAPYQFMIMLPYIFTLISLVVFARGAKAPKSLGVPFEKEGR